MSACGYFSIWKGKILCKHPEKGELYTRMYCNKLYRRCNYCKVECDGIYPSQIPHADQTGWTFDILDKFGNVFEIDKGEGEV